MRKRKLLPKLSNKPSVALRQALDDVIAVEKMKTARIKMNVWARQWEEDGTCEVCMGGAALMRRYYPPETWKLHNDFESYTEFDWAHEFDQTPDADKLDALDRARLGLWYEFIRKWPKYRRRLTLTLAAELKEGGVTPYHEDPKAFKRDIRKAIKVFEARGL